MTARANALDDLLSHIAAFVEADVSRFDRRFVRNHRLIEIGREPGDPCFEPQRIQSSHAYRLAATRTNGPHKFLPYRRELFATNEQLPSRLAEMWPLYPVARCPVDGRFGYGYFRRIGDGQAKLGQQFARPGTLHPKTSHLVRLIDDLDLRTDDVFLKRLDGPVSKRGVRKDQQFLRQAIDLYFREDVSLGIQQQRKRPTSGSELANVL